MPARGWDIFFEEPGECESKECRVCQALMEVRRNEKVANSMLAMLVGFEKEQDVFVCPYAMEDWHEQATKLMMLAHEMPSKRIEAILLDEASMILVTREATKVADKKKEESDA